MICLTWHRVGRPTGSQSQCEVSSDDLGDKHVDFGSSGIVIVPLPSVVDEKTFPPVGTRRGERYVNDSAVEEMIKIRELEEGRFERILPLLNAYKQEIGEAPLDKDGANRIREAIRNGRISFFVAQERGTPVGMCSLSTAFSTFAGGRDMGVFEDFYVLPEKRKQGIAGMLAEYVFGEAKKRNCSSVIVGCCRTDVPMYEHLGFTLNLGHMLSRVID
jgi:GNAT superfamily N-acetyltransferase